MYSFKIKRDWQKYDVPAAFIFFVVLVFFSQRKALPLPYHWDEVLVYYNPLHELLQNFWQALSRPFLFFYHPPGMQILAWPFYVILGDTPSTGRIVSGCATAIGLQFTFLLGRKYISSAFGLIAALLVFFDPLLFPQALQFHADIILFGLATAFFYLGINGRYCWAWWLGLACGLVRETSLAFGFVLGVYYLFRLAPRVKERILQALVAVSPFASLGAVFLFHWNVTGHFLNHEALTRNDIRFTGIDFFGNLRKILPRLCEEWGFLLRLLPGQNIGFVFMAVILCVIGLFLWKRGGNQFRGLAPYFLLLIAIFLFFFSFNSGFLARYLLPAFPLWVLFFFGLIWRFSPTLSMVLAALAIATSPGQYYIAAGPGDHRRDCYPESMDYTDVIRMHQRFGAYLDENLPAGARILTGWPFNSIFIKPIFGYVKRENVDGLNYQIYGQSSGEYLILGSCVPEAEEAKARIFLPGHMLVKEIREPGMWVALYAKAADSIKK